MKDFYKILGVKEDASEEEIRERWIELTKQYHPDRGEESTSNEKIREINEAYQVLKHSSTRVEYDLKRTFNHGHKRRKRTVHLKRWGVPASILIILIIVGVIYIKNFETNEINQINQTNQTNQTNEKHQRNQTDQINQTDERDQKDQTSQKDQTNLSRLPGSESVRGEMRNLFQRDQTTQKNERNQTNQRNERNQKDQKDQKDVMNPITPSVAMAAKIKKIQLLQPSQNPITSLRNDVVANKPTPSINQTDQTNQTDQINLSRLPGSESVRSEMRSLFHWDQTNVNIEIAQIKPPSLLATEDEVKKFFNDYVSYYSRKDAKSILSLFSSKAIQNQKDGLEEIRKIYADFFGEGQEIRCSLHDMKIEIYQNAVEVKARYEIEQIVKETGEKEVWRGPIRWVLIKEDGKLKILSMDYKYNRPPLGRKEESNEASQNHFYFSHLFRSDIPFFCKGASSAFARDPKSRDHRGGSSTHS